MVYLNCQNHQIKSIAKNFWYVVDLTCFLTPIYP